MKLGLGNKGGVLSRGSAHPSSPVAGGRAPDPSPPLLYLLLISVVGIIGGFVACSSTRIFSRTQMMMGNVPVTIQIRAPHDKKEKVFEAIEEAFKVAKGLEAELSEFQSTSDTSRLNNAKSGEMVSVHPALFTVLKTAEKISRITHGAFDVTYASPAPISFRDLELKDPASVHIRKKEIRIGVSGIAKGYIVDQMSDELFRRGFQEHLINAGGDLRARGMWEIGIRDPNHEGSSLCTMTLEDQSASTSGRYERGDHIVDPRTKKRVVRNDLLSTTVIGSRTVETDPLATAAFVLAPTEVAQVFSGLPKTTLFLVGTGGQIKKIGLDSVSCSP